VSYRKSRARVWSSLFAIAILSGMLTLVSAAPAFAFSSAPHTEMVEDAMTAEGFSDDAIGVAEVNNTFMDLYQWAGAGANPYSGNDTSGLARLLVGNASTENWPMSVIAAASRSHFDNNPTGVKEGMSREGLMESLGTTAGVTGEWERLQRAVWTLLQEARVENNPQKALAVIGESSHEVEDFYAHTNWVEPSPGNGLAGSEGPGWHEHGFGSFPTWFDVPAAEREKFMIYGDSTPGHTRRHGYWSSDGNTSVVTSMNKDSPPRPYYLEAAITAYFATRQWVQAAREWINDPSFWHEMQTYQVTGEKAKELEEDRHGIFEIMLFSGRWEGQGEVDGAPGPSGAAGNLLELRHAVVSYFGDNSKSVFRKEFERNIVRLAARNPTGRLEPVPSSQELQRQMQIVVMRITRMASVGAFGLGDLWPDEADMYAIMKIDGQQYHSDVIHDHNEFTFGNPYEPFTKFKVIPKGTVEQEPVESIELEVKTSCDIWSGTDDTVYLRLGKDLRFSLNKRETNDFERCDDDTYSVPIDDAARRGLSVGDISEVSMEKSGDGIAGGWKLGGIKLIVNGQQVYKNMDINRWIEDGHLTWQANNFVRRNPIGPKIPIWLELWDDDFSGDLYPRTPSPYTALEGEDDKGDINPYDKRDGISYGYVPGKKVERTSTGANQLGGRIGFGGDLASVTYTLETIVPELIGAMPPSVAREQIGQAAPPPGKPDLVITHLKEHSATVKNIGETASGPFRLRAQSMNGNGEDTELFTDLAPGASESRALNAIPACEPIEAVVDDLEQVEEANESNNSAQSEELGPTCPNQLFVPEVEGDPQAQALQEIRDANLIPNPLPVADPTCEKIGLVVSQTPRGGTPVDAGATVTIRVGARDPRHECP
jgi:hypothetical protein